MKNVNDKKTKVISEGMLAYASTLTDKDANPESLAKAIKKVRDMKPEDLQEQLIKGFGSDFDHLLKGFEFLMKLLADLVYLTKVNPIKDENHPISKKAEEICKVTTIMQRCANNMSDTFLASIMFAFTDIKDLEDMVSKLKNDIFKNVKEKTNVN